MAKGFLAHCRLSVPEDVLSVLVRRIQRFHGDSRSSEMSGHGRQVVAGQGKNMFASSQSSLSETSEVLLREYRHWPRACGLKVDVRGTDLGETLQRALEADGTQLLEILEETHEQVGRVKVRGRYFADLLLRVLAQIRR